jgi:hypothetical protein
MVVAACAASAAGETGVDELTLSPDAVLVACDDGADVAPELRPICDVKLIRVGELAADSSPVGVALDDTMLVESPPSSQESDPLSPGVALPLVVVLFPEANVPLAEDVLVVFELSFPVRPPETPVACILASASDWESHTMDVPALLTSGKAKHKVSAEHALTCHWPLAHWANDPEMQPFSPSVQDTVE